MALAALAAGLVLGARTESASERVARDFARAWQSADYGAMHSLLSADSKSRFDRGTFRNAYVDARAVATATGVSLGEPEGGPDDTVRVPVRVATRIFGTIEAEVLLPVRDGALDWDPHLAFPGLEPGEPLTRRTVAPERASILTADGKVIAEGPAAGRAYPSGEVGTSIAGELAPPEDDETRLRLYSRGFDRDTPIGQTGLERVLDVALAGRPGGKLLAGARPLASSNPRPSKAVRTTIDSRIQQAAVTALAGRLGGIAALDPATGEVEALAGIAFSAPQPPGSTFKIITTTAALEAGLVKPGDEFPVESAAVIDGVELQNASGELCGGTFVASFAHSCNSVFAPLGVKVGAERLVQAAERFGWNGVASIPGEVPSSLPPPSEIVSPLEIGSSAIGQFEVLATPLQMASVAQTVANDGIRLTPTLRPRVRQRGIRVMSPKTAKTLTRLMEGVVEYGTGTLAQVPGVAVAGKTGTAELGDTRGDDAAEALSGDPSNTDAWFTSFAPAGNPKIAVAALFVRNGAGGTVAAPAAQLVLQTAVGK